MFSSVGFIEVYMHNVSYRSDEIFINLSTNFQILKKKSASKDIFIYLHAKNFHPMCMPVYPITGVVVDFQPFKSNQSNLYGF